VGDFIKEKLMDFHSTTIPVNVELALEERRLHDVAGLLDAAALQVAFLDLACFEILGSQTCLCKGCVESICFIFYLRKGLFF
jgi:hypothetical protein